MTRWLSVTVYRGADGCDCTRQGVTSRFATLYVPHPAGPIEDPPAEQCLVPGEKGGRLNFEPETVVQFGRWTMFGGNFVYSSDARFRETYGERPVHVHDRVES